MLRRLSFTSGVALVALALPLWSQGHPPTRSDTAPASGQRIFSSTCAGCHGLDARGGERAPNLTAPKVQQLSDQELLAIVSKGLPGTAMPAFPALAPGERRALVAYLRSLQNNGRKAPLPGDPLRGKSLFFGKAKCSTCHMLNGQGGFIAGDLSAYGRSHSPEELLHRILAPPVDEELGRVAVVTTNGGQQYRGVVRNQDNFSLQLQSLDGAFHLFTKSELKSVEYEAEPLMPANYASLLTRKQLDDIVRYILEPGGSNSTPVRNK